MDKIPWLQVSIGIVCFASLWSAEAHAPLDNDLSVAEPYHIRVEVPGLTIGNLTHPLFRSAATNRVETPTPFGYRSGSPTRQNSCQSIRSVPASVRTEFQGNHGGSHGGSDQWSGLTNYYQKYTETYGIPVLSSNNVPDDALRRACYTLRFLLADHSEVRKYFYKLWGRVAVIGQHEQTTDIPEHHWLAGGTAPNGQSWDQRARGFGATPHGPVSTGAEENILCYGCIQEGNCKDRYYNQDILLHETAHGVHLIGAAYAISGWDARLTSAYNAAMAKGMWYGQYANRTALEYFAEGVCAYFGDKPAPTNTKYQLYNYDQTLYGLVYEVLSCGNTYLKRCDTSRARENAQCLKMDCNLGSGTTDCGSSTGGGSTGGGSTGGSTGGSCRDKEDNCGYWSQHGYCSSRADYMKEHCAKSCNTCSTGGSSCSDDENNCGYWSQHGYCSSNAAYMSVHCRMSCQLC